MKNAAHAFVAPDLGGRPTGGTLYNAALIEALRAQGVSCEHYTLADAASLAQSAAETVWVDSLYLDAVPGLRARAGTRRLFLMLHYLPSLVAHGRMLALPELDAHERAALTAADGFLVTGAFMREQLERFDLGKPILCVEPGCVCSPSRDTRVHDASEPVAAIALCNVVAGKGVLGLLEALARAVHSEDRFVLDVVGSHAAEPAYAAACLRIAQTPALHGRVALAGALPHAEALERLMRSDVLLSASRMETFGMALGEARAAGVPIVARRGGNAAALVTAAAGGTLADDEAGVAACFLQLVRDRARLVAHGHAARANAALHARSWRDAALDLLSQTQRATGAS